MSSLAPEPARNDGGRLLWALRRYRFPLATVTLLILVLTGMAGLRVAQAPAVYDATATVIASELAHDPSSLPRLAEAVAARDDVLADAVRRGDLPFTEKQLKTDHVKIVPLEDNILVQVIGKGADQATAVRTANAMSEALAEALDAGGPGVGKFRVLNPAVTADLESRTSTLVVLGLMGLLAAVAAVLGIAGLLLALRRPLVGVYSTSALTGLDVLGVVAKRDLVRGRATRAHAALAHVLGERDVERVTVTAPVGTEKERTLVARGLVRAMGHSRAVFVPAVVEPARAGTREDETEVAQLARERVARHSGAVVVDGVADEGGTSSVALPRHTKAVIVVAEGQGENAVLTAVARMQRSDIAGIVFVRNAGSRRNRKAQTGASLQAVPRAEVIHEEPAMASEA